MRILAIDLGEGTRDILVYDEKGQIENFPKFILPSPIWHWANEVRKTKEHLIISGKQMGGGSFAKVIRKHQEKGYKVYMTEEAAKTIRSDLDKVKNQGIEIIPEAKVGQLDGRKIKIGDLDLKEIFEMLKSAHLNLDFDIISVAVQDHGSPQTGKSARECRFEIFRERLKTNRRIESFAYLNGVPKEFSRMNSALESIREYFNGEAAPGGDPMITGCIGLLKATQFLLGSKKS